MNQVSHILLTGAGFSRNWGGWLANEVFEYLLGCREIDEDLRRDLWQTKLQGGNFEDTLSGLQDDFERRPTMNNQIRLNGLNDALIGMFKAMAKGFVRNFEWNRDKEYWVATFLNRFTSIFTLNQDTLLEQHYFFLRHAIDGGIYRACAQKTTTMTGLQQSVPQTIFDLIQNFSRT